MMTCCLLSRSLFCSSGKTCCLLFRSSLCSSGNDMLPTFAFIALLLRGAHVACFCVHRLAHRGIGYVVRNGSPLLFFLAPQGIPDLASSCESFSTQAASVMEQYSQNKQLAVSECLFVCMGGMGPMSFAQMAWVRWGFM